MTGRRTHKSSRWLAGVLSVALVASLSAMMTTVAPNPVAAEEPPPTAPSRLASGGGNHACATTGEGLLRCWGFDLNGQTNVPADLGAPKAIDVGTFHTCAVRQDDLVRCWGANFDGQSSVPGDLGAVTSISAGNFATCAIRPGGTLRCWGNPNYANQGIPPVDLGTVTDVSVGREHSCAVTTGGAVRCWGWNPDGRATVPGDLSSVTAVSAGSNHTCAVETDGGVRCWGANGDGQVAVPGDLEPAIDVVAGGRQTCALLAAGGIRCWGDNGFGQSTPPAGTFRDLSGELFTYCAIRTDESVVCWGAGSAVGSAPATPGPTPAGGAVGVAYSHTFTSARGAPAGDFAVTDGALPAGLVLSPSGVLSGVPTQAGNATFTVGVDGGIFAAASATFTVSVRQLEPPLNQTAPRIRGIVDRPRVSRVLTVEPGTWSPAATSFSYRWLRSPDGSAWTPIDGAVGTTYRPVEADLTSFLRAEVTATNADGSTTASVTPPRTVGPAPGTTAAPKAPDVVTDLVAFGFGTGGTMDVDWRPAFRNGAALTEVNVRVIPDDGPPGAVLTLPGSARSTQIVCTGELSCTIEVWAVNAVGAGPVASVVGAFNVPAPPRVASIGIDASQLRSYAARIVTPANMGGLQVTGYSYDVSVDGGPFSAPVPLDPAVVDPDVGGGIRVNVALPCENGQVGCVYRFYATNAAGTSEPSPPTAFRNFTPPGAPRISLARGTEPGLVNATITAPARFNGLPITGYLLEVDVAGVPVPSAAQVLPADATSAQVQCDGVGAEVGPKGDRSCEVTLAAVTLAGQGSPAFAKLNYAGFPTYVPPSPQVETTSVDLVSGRTGLRVVAQIPEGATASVTRTYRLQVRACGDVACEVTTPTVTPVGGRWFSAPAACPAGSLTCTVEVRIGSATVGFSPWSIVTDDQRVAPEAPEVSVADLGASLVEVTWDVAPFGSPRLPIATWTVAVCSVSTGCDDPEDFEILADSVPSAQRSLQHECATGTTCRYVVWGSLNNGDPGLLSAPVEVTPALD